MKRSLLLRCFIVLLSLALISGNAHAVLHLHTAHGQPCPEKHDHHGGKSSSDHQHRHDNGLACCCDCLGCSSAVYLPPDSNITLAELTAPLRHDARTGSLSGRELRPDPDPPRPGTLS